MYCRRQFGVYRSVDERIIEVATKGVFLLFRSDISRERRVASLVHPIAQSPKMHSLPGSVVVMR